MSSDVGSGAAPPAVSVDAAPSHPRLFSREDTGRYALITLTLINMLNYIDRYVPSATKQYFQEDLDLTDTETSIPLTAFVFVYMLSCPFFSWLADQGYKRNRIIALGVVIWSVATAAGALAVDFWTLLISRSLVGVGEAAYATIAPALLSDFYPPAQRNRVLSCFYLAIPVGAAMGYGIGGQVGGAWGWRVAFLVAGLPGILVAVMCLAIKEPEVGATDKAHAAMLSARSSGVVGAGVGGRLPRRRSQQSLMFGLNEEGMDEELPDDDPFSAGFAVASELGGPPMVHPRSRSGSYQPPPHQHAADEEASTPAARSILVRSASGTTSDTNHMSSPAADLESVDSSGDPLPARSKIPPWGESAILLLRNPTYMFCTVGLTAVTFASGALADWIATWMNRVHGTPKDTAATLVGALTCVGGILGTAWGSWLGEYAKGKIKQPYLGVAGLNMVVTCICAWAINVLPDVYTVCITVFVAEVSLWAYTGPVTALTVNCVPANLRTRAFALQIMSTHALGDAISPTIVGAVSDATGSIKTAMLLVPAAFTVAMVVWLTGWRVLAREDIAYDGQTYAPVINVEGVEPLQRGGSEAISTMRDPLMHDARHPASSYESSGVGGGGSGIPSAPLSASSSFDAASSFPGDHLTVAAVNLKRLAAGSGAHGHVGEGHLQEGGPATHGHGQSRRGRGEAYDVL